MWSWRHKRAASTQAWLREANAETSTLFFQKGLSILERIDCNSSRSAGHPNQALLQSSSTLLSWAHNIHFCVLFSCNLTPPVHVWFQSAHCRPALQVVTSRLRGIFWIQGCPRPKIFNLPSWQHATFKFPRFDWLQNVNFDHIDFSEFVHLPNFNFQFSQSTLSKW